MDKKTILIILWLLCTIGMILHFNYYVSELFYGKDISGIEGNGQVPINVFLLRSIFYHMPFVWILLIIYGNSKFWKISLFTISILYALAHFWHFINELGKSLYNISQISLLFTILITSVILVFEHFKYLKNNLH